MTLFEHVPHHKSVAIDFNKRRERRSVGFSGECGIRGFAGSLQRADHVASDGDAGTDDEVIANLRGRWAEVVPDVDRFLLRGFRGEALRFLRDRRRCRGHVPGGGDGDALEILGTQLQRRRFRLRRAEIRQPDERLEGDFQALGKVVVTGFDVDDQGERRELDVGKGLQSLDVLQGDHQPPVRRQCAKDPGPKVPAAEELARERVELCQTLDGFGGK